MMWSKVKQKELAGLSKELGVPRKHILEADAEATRAQKAFYATIRRRGREVLESLGGDDMAAVIIGRPYNTSDAGVCQDLPFKLRKMGVLPIPMDFLPVDTVDVSSEYDRMYWRGGQDILAAAAIIRDNPHLHAVYVTNFSCGPDSFILSFFRKMMGDKPFLELELDEHTADAGVVTRCEAFFDSLKMGKGVLV
jgi:predicted nucleotide-binding protein (sugar kinase/HSP70/actin superfamily)